MKVKLGNKVKDVEVVKHNAKTVLVKLPDGNIIKRHKDKHIVKWH